MQQSNNAAVLDNLGLVIFNIGNPTQAMKYFDQALAANPADANVFYNLRQAEYKLHNYTAAR